MVIYTTTHIFYTRLIKPPLKLKDGVSYDLEHTFKNGEDNVITEPAYLILPISMIVLPFVALSGEQYWGSIALSALIIFILFLSDYSFSKRNNAHSGVIGYFTFTFIYIPVLALSVLLHLFW